MPPRAATRTTLAMHGWEQKSGFASLARARWAPYVLGGLAAAAAAVVRLVLDPLLGDRVVFLFFVPALLMAAGTGGLVPTLAVTVGAIAVGFGVLARHAPVAGNVVDAVLFAGLGVGIGVGGQWLRRSQLVATGRQAQLQAILDTVPDAMIVIDERGALQSFSPAAERLFGWTAAEVIGRNVSMLMPSPDQEAHDAYLRRYKDTGERRIIGLPRVVTAQRKDGSAMPVELFVGESSTGGRRFFTGFLQDLTERRAAEARLQAARAELVHMSRLSAMGEMAAALAHEINQPLSAISNYLKGGQRLLEAENPDSRAIPAMARAAEQSLRAGEIIRRLREFVARGESERQIESLEKLIEESAALGLVGGRERGVSVQIIRDPTVDLVFVDKVQVQQVVLNLLRNALEAMEDCQPKELRIATSPGEHGLAMVSVTDTGPGISPAIADRLFQPFVTTKGAQGMGVGLSICRTIVEAHGGRIWVEPNTPAGTVFKFTLPRGDGREGE
ncbi:MAG: PAS domain S-box protein [Caulobacteraceae bacterium]